MKNWFKKFLWIIPLFLLAFSASSTDGGDGDRSGEETSNTKSLRKIGVEIETNAIKIKGTEGTNVGFEFSLDDKVQWKLEDDTRDTRDGAENSIIPQYNLEMHTVNGYNFLEFNPIFNLMTKLLKQIHQKCQSSEGEYSTFSTEDLVEMAHGNSDNTSIPYDIRKFHLSQSNLELKIIKGNISINPQVTYELSLEEIPRMFDRMTKKGHRKIEDFCEIFKEPFEKFVISEKNSNKERFKRFSLLNYFNETFIPKLKEPVLSKKVIGFSYLFLFYWENLFHNGIREVSDEPGPKSSLAIMSRIPFSEMYDFSLNDIEQHQFTNLFDEEIKMKGEEYKLIDYLDRQEERFSSQLALLQWYNSIINRAIEDNTSTTRRQKLTRKEKEEKNPRRTVGNGNSERSLDALSPPPKMGKEYAMGYYPISKTNPLALLEVRGYPAVWAIKGKWSMKGSDVFDKMVDDLYDKVTGEVRWFFEQEQGKE